MVVNDVRQIFNIAEEDDFLVLPNKSTVRIEKFAELFSSAPAKPKYEDLLNIDANTKGYREFFDQCKAEGILD